jgi:surface carbohydrate biosynthesis protein
MRIALVVNSPFRDVPGAALTALRLCQSGATCYLVPTYLSERELWCLAPDCVLLENFRTYNQELARRLLEAGIRVAVLDTDAGVFRDLEWYGARLGRDAGIRRAISSFCAWGPRLAQYLVERGFFGEAQVQVTGAPRFDFYAEPWRQASLAISPASGMQQPLILVAGNFHFSNPRDGATEVAVRTRLGLPGQDAAAVERWLDTERLVMRRMVELVNRLAGRLPEVHFVYRPHPFENLAPYEELLEKRPNLRLAREGTVDGWLLRASAIIQKGCTTAIEATLAGIPALSPAWIPTPLELETVEAVSVHCASEEELVEAIQAAVRGDAVIPDRVRRSLESVVAAWFFQADGRAHERVAAAVRDAASAGGRVSLDRCADLLDGLAGPRPGWKRRARALARRTLGLPVTWSFRHGRDTPDLSWDASERRYGVEQVQAVAAAVEPAARSFYGGKWRPVRVEAALANGHYQFRHDHGRSVALIPAA